MTTKRKTIYIRVLEASAYMLPVDAIDRGESAYKIVKNADMSLDDDPTTIYEFFPGDIVICEQVYGKSYIKGAKRRPLLLAKKLLSSTFPDREIHRLIFMIVESSATITPQEVQSLGMNPAALCGRNDVLQTKHPAVKMWLQTFYGYKDIFPSTPPSPSP